MLAPRVSFTGCQTLVVHLGTGSACIDSLGGPVTNTKEHPRHWLPARARASVRFSARTPLLHTRTIGAQDGTGCADPGGAWAADSWAADSSRGRAANP
jgi:hypothetical protein